MLKFLELRLKLLGRPPLSNEEKARRLTPEYIEESRLKKNRRARERQSIP